MTIKEIAKELGLSKSWTVKLVANGEIKGIKNQWSFWEVSEEDFDNYLLSREYEAPNWYLKLVPYKRMTTVEDLEEDAVAQPHQVSIKNYLPTLTPNEYLQAVKRSEERNK